MSWLLCCLYLQGGLAVMQGMNAPPPGIWWAYDINHVVNPYGVLEVGYERPFKQFAIQLALRHNSSIPARDHGQNTAEIGLRWYPGRGID